VLAVLVLAAFICLLFISCLVLSILFFFRASRYTNKYENEHEVVSPIRTVASLVVEACSTTLLALLYPFGIFAARKPVKKGGHPHWIIMVHGYGHNRAALFILRRRLEKMGLGPCRSINLKPAFGPLEEAAKNLAGQIEQAFGQLPDKSLTLVAHSMGGLVCRYYIQELGGDCKVTQLITVGTPHTGTHQAELGFGEAAGQMLVGSPFLQKLNDPARLGLTRVKCIWSSSDNVIIPRTSALLPGQQAYRLEGLGHNAMLFSTEVARRIGELILGKESLAAG
jgi:triacylglycerol lipase